MKKCTLKLFRLNLFIYEYKSYFAAKQMLVYYKITN